jgi:peptide/nickel transport system ATP-binding protein
VRALRRELQFIFQDPYSSLNPRMSVLEIIMEPLLIDGQKKDNARRRAEELMEMVGLTPRVARSYPHELDGGRRQRIGVARALALNPKFVICDEPVSALDVSIQAQVLNLMQDLQEQLGLTYIFITHNLSVVSHISSNIMVMYLGKVVEYSPTESLFESPMHPYTQALLSSIPSIDLDAPKNQSLLQGEITSPINPPPGCRFASRCPYARDICHAETPELKEYAPNHKAACFFVEKSGRL